MDSGAGWLQRQKPVETGLIAPRIVPTWDSSCGMTGPCRSAGHGLDPRRLLPELRLQFHHLTTEILHNRHRQTFAFGAQPCLNAPDRRVRLTIPQPTREHGLTDQIEAAFRVLVRFQLLELVGIEPVRAAGGQGSY